jgi:putative peptide zinc metalloprotease protein
MMLALGLIIVLFVPYPFNTGGPFKIMPVRRVEIHADVEGKIAKIMVKEGQRVIRGQPLAFIDQREHEKNLKLAQQQLAEAEAQLRLLVAGAKPEDVEKAQKEVNEAQVRVDFSFLKARRFQELYKKGFIAEQEYEDVMRRKNLDFHELDITKANLQAVKSGARKEELEAKEAEVKRLQTLVDNFRKELSLTTLEAPVDGTIETAYIDQKVGQYLRKGDFFGVIQNSERVQVEIAIWEGDVPEVRQGAIVRAAPWSYPNRNFEGKVLAVASSAVMDSHERAVIRVLAELANTDGLLRPEMTGYAKIETETKPVWQMLARRVLRWFRVEVWYWIP